MITEDKKGDFLHTGQTSLSLNNSDIVLAFVPWVRVCWSKVGCGSAGVSNWLMFWGKACWVVTNESDSRMTGKRRRTATQEVSLVFTVHHKLLVLLGQIHNKVTFYSRFAGTLLDWLVAMYWKSLVCRVTFSSYTIKMLFNINSGSRKHWGCRQDVHFKKW